MYVIKNKDGKVFNGFSGIKPNSRYKMEARWSELETDCLQAVLFSSRSAAEDSREQITEESTIQPISRLWL